MMKRRVAAGSILSGVVALQLGACATVVADIPADKSARQFVTGSNVPLRDRAQSAAKTVDKEEFERARLEMQPKVKGN